MTQKALSLAEREEIANSRAPGWQVWATLASHGPVTWSARPDGAPSAVITGAASGDDVLAKITEYERDVDRHLAEARARLAAADMSNIGRDEARTTEALTGALEAMKARLFGGY